LKKKLFSNVSSLTLHECTVRCSVSRMHRDSDENVKSALILAVLFANNVFITARQGVTV
jgi:hypothetical protein